MAIVAIIGAVIGAIGVWWWRAQQVKGAAEGVLDAAGKARGMIDRARFRQKAGQAVLAGVDSPGMAAATLMYSLAAQRGAVLDQDKAKIEGLLASICRMNRQDIDDAMAFAPWAAEQVADTNEVVRRFLPCGRARWSSRSGRNWSAWRGQWRACTARRATTRRRRSAG